MRKRERSVRNTETGFSENVSELDIMPVCPIRRPSARANIVTGDIFAVTVTVSRSRSQHCTVVFM